MRDAVSQPTATGGATHSVVVGSDFSELGDRAFSEGVRLCWLYPRAALHVITVATESPAGVLLPGGSLQVRPHLDAIELARAHVAELSSRYCESAPWPAGLDKIAVYVVVGSPAERIVTLAAAIDADVIVIGTHARRGIDRMILGSVAQEVVKRAPCGVFVLRPRDFLDGEKLPQIQPPLQPGEHALLPYRESVTYHYVDRMTHSTDRLAPGL
jgi:nucleotide-binding universal stress UspA family protein